VSGRMVFGLAVALAVVIGGVLLGIDRLGVAAQLIITASHVHKAPTGLDDPVWEKARAVPVTVKGRDDLADAEEVVLTKALYTDDSIYFLFKWKDPTRSVTKEAWHFDGQKWTHLKGDEDRLALLFEITRINNFATKGCAVTCHSPADAPREQWKLATRTTAEKGDLWHWKAARSDPYNYADDGWLTVAGKPSGAYRETGRNNDSGSGGDLKNETPDGSRPLSMQNPAERPSVPGLLLSEEAVKITDYSVFKPGDIVPYRLPVKPSGSRFDVKALSRYGDGGWTVMLSRKLDTGHEEDVAFDPRKRYSFAMAVFDDSGADHSKATQTLTLEFAR